MSVHLGMEFLSSVTEQHPKFSTVSNASPAVLSPVLSAETQTQHCSGSAKGGSTNRSRAVFIKRTCDSSQFLPFLWSVFESAWTRYYRTANSDRAIEPISKLVWLYKPLTSKAVKSKIWNLLLSSHSNNRKATEFCFSRILAKSHPLLTATRNKPLIFDWNLRSSYCTQELNSTWMRCIQPPG